MAFGGVPGKLMWRTRIGPGGPGGGILWGSATDGARIYSAETDSGGIPYKLKGSGYRGGDNNKLYAFKLPAG